MLGTSQEFTRIGPVTRSPQDGGQDEVLKGMKFPLTSDLSRCVFTDSTFR